MKIVIDIPDELKNQINYDNYESIIRWYSTALYCAIENGTPLPKGHGDLIDRSKIEWYGCNFEGSRTCRDNNGNCDICDHAECYAKQVRELQTIIEADTEGGRE